MVTFTGTTLQWFSEISDGHITFPQFSRMFREHFSANKVKPPRLYDLFNVKQREGEALRGYLNRFFAVMVRLQIQDEEMIVAAFVQGMSTGPFNERVVNVLSPTLRRKRPYSGRIAARACKQNVLLLLAPENKGTCKYNVLSIKGASNPE